MTNDQAPAVDVVVCTRGRGDLIETTMASVRRSTYEDFVCWVVDQSDDDRTAQVVARHAASDPRVRYLRVKSRGVGVARNEGLAAGHAPFVVFTDDDCDVTPGWLATMVRGLREQGAAAVFGRILPGPDPRPASALRGEPPSRALPMALKDTPMYRIYERSRLNLGFGHGASMGFRRSCLEAIGGFDVLLGAGSPLRSWPERDVGFRILKRGWRIIYDPEALIYHLHWRSWPEMRRTYRDYAIGAGATVSKYLRCGDLAGLYILVEWLADQGIRQVMSGLLKWRSRQKVIVGLLQLVYPWVGIAMSTRYGVDRERMLYMPRSDRATR